MEYRVRVVANGRSAKNKGIVTGRWTSRTEAEDKRRNWDTENFTLSAQSHEEAFRKVSAEFQPSDKRPLAGVSYMRLCALKPRKVGAKVRTVVPYAFNPETEQGIVTAWSPR